LTVHHGLQPSWASSVPQRQRSREGAQIEAGRRGPQRRGGRVVSLYSRHFCSRTSSARFSHRPPQDLSPKTTVAHVCGSPHDRMMRREGLSASTVSLSRPVTPQHTELRCGVASLSEHEHRGGAQRCRAPVQQARTWEWGAAHSLRSAHHTLPCQEDCLTEIARSALCSS
jgi:hypothetical protein